MPEKLDNPVVMVPGVSPDDAMPERGPECRFTPRFPFTAAAEVTEIQSQTRIASRSSDLGLGGCYIDSICPFSVGDAVLVCLERESRKFEAMGRIVSAHISMGMGIAFTDIKPQYALILRTWMAELSGEIATVSETIPQGPAIDTTVVTNTWAVLNELVNLLVRKRIINEMEGTILLRQMFR
jgi:hypothetical protein